MAAPKRKAKGLGPMMGSNGDSGEFSPPRGAYNYSGKSGQWKNRNGTVIGRSTQEDSTITPYKSTGDTAAVTRYVKQRRAAGAKGY